MIWPRNFKVKEVTHSESSKGGPEAISFSYTATFALLLCEGPIAGIGRIWMNKKLMYDPLSSTQITDVAIGWSLFSRPAPAGMTFYLGTEEQLPDPIMVAADGSAPAYRGWAYIVFENLELTKSGFANRPPSVEVEVFTNVRLIGPPSPRVIELGASAPIAAFEAGAAIVDPITGLIWSSSTTMFGPSLEVRVNSDGLKLQVRSFSVPLSSIMGGGKGQICYVPTSATTGEIWAAVVQFGVWVDRFAIFNAASKTYLTLATGLYHGTAGINVIAYNPVTNKVMAFRDGGGVSLVNVTTRGVLTLSDFYLGESPGSLGTVWIQACIITPLYFCVHSTGSYTKVTIRRLSDYSHVATITTGYGSGSTMFYDPVRARLILCAGSKAFEVINLTTFAVTSHTYTTPTGADTSPAVAVAPLTGAYAGGNYIFGAGGDTGTGSTLYTVNPTTLVCDYAYTYEAYTGTQLMCAPLLSPLDTTRPYVYSFDRDSVKRMYFRGAFVGAPVTLASIVSALSTREPFGLGASDIDVTQLTDLVDGYLVGQQMTRRQALEPLMAAYSFDAIESDHKIKYVKRGSAPVISIPQSDRAAHEEGSARPPNLAITRASELDRPWMIDVNYIEAARDYQIGTQYDRRITRNSNDPRSVSLPIVMSASKAKQVASILLYQPWLRMRFSFSTGVAYSKYEPTDVITLPDGEVTYTARITTRNDQGNGVIQWQAELEDPAVYSQMGTVAESLYVPATIADPGATLLELLDTPIMRDADDNAGFYVAMGGTTDGWPGAQLFKSADEGSTYAAMLSQSNAATSGTVASALGDFTAGNIPDNGNSFTVALLSGGPLTSVTLEQALNGSNTAVIGAHGRWEVINFLNAALISANTYVISGLLRGRRGTEWATGTHAVGDTLVLVGLATWQRAVMGTGEIGVARKYRAPPFGTTLSSSPVVDFTEGAVGLEPYSPVDVTGVRDTGGNLTISWNRRSRLGYGTLNALVPLGEATESYSLDVMSGATVLRTLTSATPTAPYSAANQTADGVTLFSPVSIRLYMLSAVVGRGYAAIATI